MARIAVLALAAVTLGVVGLLVWGSWSSGDDTSVGELPTVSEIVAAQAHRHGVDLPELSEADRARLSAPPSAASTLSPYEQVLGQLIVVRDSAGVDEALAILGEVALQSDVVAGDCARLYAAIAGESPTSITLSQVCPG